MVNLYTISDKALMGKQMNILQSYIAENLFKNNLKISRQCVLSSTADFSFLKNLNNEPEIYIILVDKGNYELNQTLCDITKSVIVENPYLKNSIYDYFKKINTPMEKESEDEWKIPSKARAIINPNGVVQGYMLVCENKTFYVLPNNFDETSIMFDNVVLENILSNQKKKYKSHTFKTFGLTCNAINTILAEEIKNKNKITVNLFEKPMEVDIVIKSLDDNTEIDNLAKSIFLKLDKYIYAVEDIPIEKVVYDLLKMNDITVSFVEDISCGEIASRLRSQANDAKKYIELSCFVPTKESKIKEFNLNSSLFDTQDKGAQIAYEMAVKQITKSGSNVVVSNVCDFSENNTGVCFIAVGDGREIHVYKNNFRGNFNEVKDSVTVASYFYLIKKLKKNDFHFEQTTV